MSKEDYQKKIEEHRQSIGIENEGTELRRSRRNATGKKKKKKNVLIPSLFAIFILLPASVLIYVQFFYEPEDEESTEEVARIEVETKPISNINNSDEKEETEQTTEPVKTDEVKQEETPEVAPSTPVAVEKPVEKVEPVAPVQPKPKEEKKEEKVQDPKPEAKTHIVKGNETLYRIAINYYKNPDAVEKIKAANGLASNEIYEGQKLILP